MARFRRQPDDPYGQQYPQQHPQQPPQPYPYGGGDPSYQQQAPYGSPGPAGPGYYDEPGPDPQAPPPAPPPPPLHWKELLSGIVFRPSATFWRMRDYSMWWPALIVTFLYGLVAVFGLDSARESVLDTTTSTLAPYLLVTGAVMMGGALLLGTVTHNLARQFGGNGLWAPTAGLAMLIMTLTDVPRLAVALFLGGADPVVQVIGWATWLGAGLLFTMMVSRSHEIAWPRALAASSIQLLAILALVKLGTL
ncbi:Yip1 family protein [Streptomyces sp. B6B3]|uniref:Yip1 family protein n=1 Tax=Streptomyces sp. B6B3 TaxID=3153570 RepID=UPI00325F186A